MPPPDRSTSTPQPPTSPDSESLHAQRMARFRAAGLYLVTSRALSLGRSTQEVVARALAGGARLIQLREKDLTARDYAILARQVREITHRFNALLIINDRLDVALAVGADGVHLGQDDFPVHEARRLAPDLIIGASTHSESEALQAQAAGASYVNIGPLFPTGTKQWSGEFLGLAGLRRIAPTVTIPFTVMGGIKLEQIPALRAAGANIIALVTAITTAPDPTTATRDLLRAIRD